MKGLLHRNPFYLIVPQFEKLTYVVNHEVTKALRNTKAL